MNTQSFCVACGHVYMTVTLHVCVFVQIPPYEREIYVITMIKVKINQHCEEQASGGAAA